MSNICPIGPLVYSYKKWVSLTNHLTWSLCDSLQPVSGRVDSVTDFVSTRSNTQSRKQLHKETKEGKVESGDQSDDCSQHEEISELNTVFQEKDGASSQSSTVTQNKDGISSQSSTATQDKDGADVEPRTLKEAESKLPQMEVKVDSVIRFSKIPQKYPPGSTPTEITKCSMDSSYALEKMISDCYYGDENGILGEIQFSFICLLIGQIYDAFDQWKHLVHLLCSSEDALSKHDNLFNNFITVLYFQLQEIPEDFFVDIVSQNNFLTTTLHEFFSNVESCPPNNTVRKKALRFRDHLTQKFKWDFTSEPDDCAPVIVDLS